MKKRNWEKYNKAMALYTEGVSGTKIAEECNVPVVTIYGWFGKCKRSKKVEREKTVLQKKEEVKDKYLNNSSAKELATEYGVSVSTIHRWINMASA